VIGTTASAAALVIRNKKEKRDFMAMPTTLAGWLEGAWKSHRIWCNLIDCEFCPF
jgi:hypothetical protein